MHDDSESEFPRSEFVRRIIASLAFTKTNREYVHELRRLEEIAVHGLRSFAEAMHFHHHLKHRRFEYEAILRELDPAALRRQRKTEREAAKQDAERRAELAAERRREREADRELWARCRRR